MSHTEGKLKVYPRWVGVTENGKQVFSCWTSGFCMETDGANAHRLVTCWNEHDGLVHDNARLYESLNSEMRARIEAEKERDELVAALRRYRKSDWGSELDVDALLAKYPEAS